MKYGGIIIFLISSYMYGAVGCKDISKHGYRCNDGDEICCNAYDYKMLHFVPCPCPCNNYTAMYTRGRCSNCLHYNVPEELVIQWEI
ncbi:MAG: hypothetical protein WC707_02700 [Candidatus Babeliaceae bacterium]|jgi:hypothetical protein